MPPKKGDPFNFDDMFIAAGAEGLVKKTMGEMKRSAGTASGSSLSKLSDSGPEAAARKPIVPTASAAPAQPVHLPAGSLDFLTTGSLAANGTPPKPASKPVPQYASPGIPTGADLFGEPLATGVPTTAGSGDPFAMFDDLPGAETVPQPAPPASTVAPVDDGFLGFEDVPGVVSPPPPPEPKPAPKHMAAESRADSSGSAYQGDGLGTGVQGPPQPPIMSSAHVSRPGAAMGPTASPPYREHNAVHARASSATLDTSSSYGHGNGVAAHSRDHSGGSVDDWHRQQQKQQAQPQRRGFYDSDPDAEYGGGSSSSSAPLPPRSQQPAAGGMMGMLKGLGKRAVKAAQVGLQTIETALERMDGSSAGGGGSGATAASSSVVGRRDWGPSGQHHHHQHYSSDQPAGYAATFDGSPVARSHLEGSRQGLISGTEEDEATSAALAIMALPPAERGEVIATLPAHQQRRVQRVLDELTQGEERAPLSAAAGVGLSSSDAPVDIRTSAVDFDAWDAPGTHTAAGGGGGGGGGVPRRPQPASVASSAVVRPAPAAPTQPAPAAPRDAVHHDLLGMSSAPHPPQREQHEEDLLGMSPHATPAAAAAPVSTAQPTASAATTAMKPPAPPPASAPPRVADVDDMHDFFSGGGVPAQLQPQPQQPTAAAPPSHASSRPAAAATPPPAAGSHSDSLMMDLSDALNAPDVDVSAHADLYKDTEATEGEPELRKQLRAARLAEQHAKMKSALAAKLATEEAEARARAEQVELKHQYAAAVDVWKNKNKGNIRGLLSSLQTVLWEDSGWKPVGMADLLEGGQIRKVWMKANLLVHPDKVRQRAGSAEQVARADMIFDVLKDAWNAFQTSGR